MPSKLRQLNVRLTDEDEDRLRRLKTALERTVGLALSQSDLVRLALAALEEKHLSPRPKR